jgi:penicillin-binding protein 1C
VPQNYDRRYKGYASVRTSLASSLNIPAVRTLMLTGLERFHERLREVG